MEGYLPGFSPKPFALVTLFQRSHILIIFPTQVIPKFTSLVLTSSEALNSSLNFSISLYMQSFSHQAMKVQPCHYTVFTYILSLLVH